MACTGNGSGRYSVLNRRYRYGTEEILVSVMGANTGPVKVQVPVPYPRRLSVGLSYTHTLTHLGEKSNCFCVYRVKFFVV